VIRPRGATTRQRDDQRERSDSSVEEIGRLLRDTREVRGLDLLAVHDRLSRPITQIEALENGDLASLPDQALAISTLRRYATFLGLDGDALALQMIDAWSTMPKAPAGPSDQGAVLTNVVAAVTTGPDHLRAFTQTGKVPKVGGRSNSVAGGVVATGPPTGTFPVVPRDEIRQSKRAVAKARRRMRAPTSLKLLTWTAAILLLAVVVGFGIQQWRPQWLASSHILRVVPPHGAPATNPATTPATNPATHSHQTTAVAPGPSIPNGSSFTVDTSHFTVNVATSGPCWVQITSSSSATPLVSGVQPAGKGLSFPATGTMTVQVGSSKVIVGVAIKGKNAFVTTPRSAPYTYVFAPVR
jgi:cytoskeleton protein RodZ